MATRLRYSKRPRWCWQRAPPGITVHPRSDERHIRATDVDHLSEFLASEQYRGIEFNIEGDPRADFIEMVKRVRPDQCTLVPVRAGEITSEAGWPADTPKEALSATIAELRALGVRVSLFVDPQDEAIQWAADMGADRIELYTEPFARAFEAGEQEGADSFESYRKAAVFAHGIGLGINAGHDLDLSNLPLFSTLPHLDEVSIGHALISRAVFEGLDGVVRQYIQVLEA